MKDKKIKDSIRLLEEEGCFVTAPEPKETDYWKAIRTGVKPSIWPPLFMDRDELDHFRAMNNISRASK